MDTSFRRSPAHRYHNFTLPTSIHILTRKLCAHHGFNLPVPNAIDVSDQKRLLDLDNTDRNLPKPPKKMPQFVFVRHLVLQKLNLAGF